MTAAAGSLSIDPEWDEHQRWLLLTADEQKVLSILFHAERPMTPMEIWLESVAGASGCPYTLPRITAAVASLSELGEVVPDPAPAQRHQPFPPGTGPVISG